MISIVIPTLNEAHFVGVLLRSLAAQAIAEPLEVVVADSRSTDETRRVVATFSGHFARLSVVDGGSPAVGRNRGALAGSGDPIFFIDADLELRDPRFLIENAAHLREKRLAAGTVRLTPTSDRWCDHALVGVYNGILRPARWVRPLGSMCIVSSRSVFLAVGGFPEDVAMAEDHDFVLRCANVGRYGILPVRAHFSVRRLEAEGRLTLVKKYLWASWLRVFRGPIRQFDYEFGCFGDREPSRRTALTTKGTARCDSRLRAGWLK